MRIIHRQVIVITLAQIAWLLVVPSAAMAQSGRKPQGSRQDEKPIVRLETREVVVPLRAYDVEGRFVDDLKAQDVLVLEEGESRPVSYIKREPANIVLVLDLNNGIGTFKNGPTERLGREKKPIWDPKDYKVISEPTTREFARKFISAMSPDDQISIIQFSDKVELVQDWTNDSNKALRSLDRKYRIGLNSSYFDALVYAAERLGSRRQGRNVVVLVTEGIDTVNRIRRSEALKALARSRAAVYVVCWAEALRHEIEIAAGWMYAHETHSSSNMERVTELRRYIPRLEAAASELRQLAESSGGEFWLPETHNDLIASWRPLTSEIGAQYTLSFITESKPSMEPVRSILVLPARKGLNVRSSKTYYISDDERPYSQSK